MSGIQSILEISRENYLDKVQNDLLSMSDAYYYKKKFLVGEGVDRGRLKHNLVISEILSTSNCEVIDYVQKKIEDKLAPCKKKKNIKQRFKEYQEQCDGNCEITQIITETFDWSEISW